MNDTPKIERSDAAGLLAGLSLADALTWFFTNDPQLTIAVARHVEIPTGEMVWLDALRKGALPSLYWAVDSSFADFGVMDLAPLICDSTKIYLSSALIRSSLDAGNVLLYSSFSRSSFVESGMIDKYLVTREKFRSLLSSTYRSFFDLLSSSQLVAEAFNPATMKTERIDRHLWRLDRYFINIGQSTIHVNHRAGDPPLFEGVRLLLPTPVEVIPTSSPSGRGAPERTDWEEVCKHFVISLHEDGWPSNHASALKRLTQILEYLGFEVPKGETISAAMSRHIGPLWALFPKGSRPQGDRFAGMTAAAPKSDHYSH